MDSSYLQSFIDNNTNYISIFKKNNFKIIKNSKYKLILVKNYYNNELNFNDENDYWKMYCRGAVIDIINHKVVCLPPVKSKEISLNDDILNINDDIEFQTLVDGTMINLFYHNNEWIISTRSDIGGFNKWSDKKSFRKLFDECSIINYDLLNKNHSYSFVMRHKDNRNISPINNNELFLVDTYEYSNNKILQLSNDSLTIKQNFNIIDSTKNSNIFKNTFNQDVPYYSKGFTIKYNSKRYKFINPNFELVKNLKLNLNNPELTYLHLRQNGNLKIYLKYFPEHSNLFNEYRDKIHLLSNHLYSTYKNVFIHKNLDKKDIPYHLNPLIYDIHKLYLKNKNPTSWNDIKNYIHNLPPKKLLFALNYS